MKKSILLLFTLGALTAAAQTGTVPSYYLASHGTNIWPPLPFNPKPGYPVITNGNNRIVQDTISDADTLTQGLWLMETDSYGPIPDGDETNAPPVPDTNAFLGMYLYGLLCPGGENHSWNRRPDCWEINCAKDNWSPYDHVAGWTSMTRVCPGDAIRVRYHEECQYHTPPWPCCVLIEYGTNANGYFTNMAVCVQTNYSWYGVWVVPDSLQYMGSYQVNTAACKVAYNYDTNSCWTPGPDSPIPTNHTCFDNWHQISSDTNSWWSQFPIPPFRTIEQDEVINGPMWDDPVSCILDIANQFQKKYYGNPETRQQQNRFQLTIVHGPPGIYTVEAADSLGGSWTTNADVFMGSLADLSYSTNTGYTWTNTTAINGLFIDTNGLTGFCFGNNQTNASRFYRLRLSE